ncbi:MAG: amidophosphoribosyltransferase [Pseudomonadota bacterium]
MCGIVGIVGKSPVNQAIYDALTILQHRGQDAAGAVTIHDGRFFLRKANGLVNDVFAARHMQRLKGNTGIGHVRYPTAGSSSSEEAHPLYVNSPFGIVFAHNGNLTNHHELAEELFKDDRRHINTSSDSEVLLNVFAHELQHCSLNVTPEDVFNAVSRVHQRCRGAYAAVAIINGLGIVAFRDPNGIRPAVFGKRETPDGDEYMVSSESVALDVLGFKLERDIQPGEAIVITNDGHLYTKQCAEAPSLKPCIFEHVYLARPDSMLDNILVYKARLRMGEKLGEKILREWPDHDIDVVIPIPDTSTTSAMELAHCLDVKMRHGFIKNRYIGRTFIMPGQTQRVKSVRRKLNAIELEFKGKNVLLVDDSIVRGTTSNQIIQMAREAGANKVYMASAAPPVRFPNVYGIDMPAASELIAHGRDVETIQDELGADKLFYQDLDDLIDAAREGNPEVDEFDCSVFTGNYVTGDIDQSYLDRIEMQRNDIAKQPEALEEIESNGAIDLHNPE